jgi:CRISPR-associated protein Cmr6
MSFVRVVARMNSQNLNYYYYVEYFEGNDINFLQPDSCEDALKRKNKALTDHCVKKQQLMSPVPENLAPHAVELQTVYPGMLIGTGISHGFGGKGEAALGLCLDYVTGMPYIPGSSVKGALRSAFAHPEYIKKLLNDAQVKNADSLDVNELEAQMFGNPLKGKQYDVKNNEKDIFYDAIVVSEGKILATDVPFGAKCYIDKIIFSKEKLNLTLHDAVINGYPDGTFKPESNITRAECAALVQRAAKISVMSDTQAVFGDVQPFDWYYGIVSTLADKMSIFYIDVNPVFDDADGNLEAGYTSDGIHVLASIYQKWSDWYCLYTIPTT